MGLETFMNLRLAWRGESRNARVPYPNTADHLHQVVDELYHQIVDRKEIPYIVIRYEGRTEYIHAVLVTSVKPDKDGADIYYIDSNSPSGRITHYRYHNGDIEIFTSTGHGPVYIQRNDEIQRYAGTLARECGLN
jgi:hypothetical protein